MQSGLLMNKFVLLVKDIEHGWQVRLYSQPYQAVEAFEALKMFNKDHIIIVAWIMGEHYGNQSDAFSDPEVGTVDN